tara:strand:+ start:1085 stop:1363 length:279 start_codon:yes stop_codon:yes gene_type:complete
MNKSELVRAVTDKKALHNSDDVDKSVRAILNLISDSLCQMNRVEIRGFGTFSVRSRDKRLSRNPKTGTSVLVEEKKHPYFRAAKSLKESLNK